MLETCSSVQKNNLLMGCYDRIYYRYLGCFGLETDSNTDHIIVHYT